MSAPLARLLAGERLSRADWRDLLEHKQTIDRQALFRRAAEERRRWFGDEIYVRGLIELTSYCKNNCLYCGIRAGNSNAGRYRLEEETVLECCKLGYGWGFRTFVLQGGEDPWFTGERVARLVEAIKKQHPDCAVTLSLGEHPRQVYQAWFDAGADRYLLRHETAHPGHYASLHPPGMTLERRMACLHDLKDIGYQVGAGFMVGSPGQTAQTLAEDLFFLQEFRPHMVGLGPFIPQHDTPLRHAPAGTLEDTLLLLALVRLALPGVLLPATTALGTIHPRGRQLGIEAGANVVMPNLSPPQVRGQYSLYDNKLATGAEGAENMALLRALLAEIGCTVAVSRGDYPTQTDREAPADR